MGDGDKEADRTPTVTIGPSEAGVEDTLVREEDVGRLVGGPATGDFPLVGKNHYEVGSEIARGGLGRIMVAFDRTLNRHVAIKELLVSQGHAEERFVREALITARLEHPNIVTVHEAGRWSEGERFYSMQLVQGRTLSLAIDQARAPLDRLALVPAIIDVCDAVAYAHSQRVLHRDLKPANVMLGPFGETVLLDWGLAKDLDADKLPPLPSSEPDAPLSPFHTADGIVVGTPPYMPPEQAAAVGIDERSDVYSLGAMLYNVLSGLRPYHEAPDAEVLEAVVTRPPVPLSEVAEDMPVELVAITNKAMARLPEDRYPTAQEMAQELRRFTTGQLVGAYVYTPWEMITRFAQRHFAAMVTAALALVILVSFGAWSFRSITEERNQAQLKEQVALRNLDRSLLERARSLLDRDPTATLNVLRQISDISHVSPGAASVAAEAEDLGVARHIWNQHSKAVDTVVSGPAGVFVSAGRDGQVHAWTLNSTSARVVGKHDDRVSSLTVSADGRWVASGSHDGRVGLWPLSGTGQGRFYEGHEGSVLHVEFSPDQKRLVSASEDKTLRVWRLDRDDVEVLHLDRADRSVMARFIDDERLVSAGHGGRLRLWDLASGRGEVWGQIDDPQVAWIDVSPDRKWVAAASEGGQLILRNLETSQNEILKAHAGGVKHLAFSPDSRRLATAGQDWKVLLWDLSTLENRAFEGHLARVTRVSFSDDGAMLASGSWDKTIIVHSLHTGGRQTLKGHGDVVSSLAMQEGLLVSSSWDNSLRAWSVSSSPTLVYTGHTIGVHAVAYGPKDQLIASGGHDDTVRLWGSRTKTLKGHTDHVFAVAVSPDGKWVASSADDKTVRLWPVAGGEAKVLEGHTADVEEIRFSADGRFLASASEDHRVIVWSTKTFEGRTLSEHTDAVTDLLFHSASLWSSSRDGTVRSWRLPNLEPQLVLRHPAAVTSIDRVGPRVATAAEDGVVRLWKSSGELSAEFKLSGARRVRSAADGRTLAVTTTGPELWVCLVEHEVCDQFKGHSAAAWDIEFDPAGNLLVSASADGDVRVWDVETGESRVFRGHQAAVFDLDVSSDGHYAVSGSGDNTVRRWALRAPPRPEELPQWIRARIGSD